MIRRNRYIKKADNAVGMENDEGNRKGSKIKDTEWICSREELVWENTFGITNPGNEIRIRKAFLSHFKHWNQSNNSVEWAKTFFPSRNLYIKVLFALFVSTTINDVRHFAQEPDRGQFTMRFRLRFQSQELQIIESNKMFSKNNTTICENTEIAD